MDLYLLRHGIAMNAGATATDSSRPLTDKGSKRIRKAARGLRRLGVSFDAILTSPLPRAHQTATLVAEALGQQGHLSALEALKPGGSPDDLLLSLKDYNHCGNLLLVGHEPLLSDTACFLLSGKKSTTLKIALKKGGLCQIEIDALPPRTPGTLRLLLQPKLLRLLAKRG